MKRAVIKALFVGAATAAGGAIFTYLAGYWPALAMAAGAVASAAWGTIVYPVALPLGVVVLGGLPWLGIIALAVAIAIAARKPAAAPAVVPVPPPLSDLELRIMRVLAGAGGAPVDFESLADQLRTPRLVLERACESLFARQYVEAKRGSIYGTSVMLTRPGRDFVIDQGFPLG